MIAATEVYFVVAEGPGGGFTARAVGTSIVTEADDRSALHAAVRDAVRCHFDPTTMPKLIRLHFGRDEILVV